MQCFAWAFHQSAQRRGGDISEEDVYQRGPSEKRKEKTLEPGALSGRYNERRVGRDRSSNEQRLGVSELDVQSGAERDQAVSGVMRADALLGTLQSLDSFLDRVPPGSVDQFPILAPQVESRRATGAGVQSFLAA